ncbi:hypothetical protein DPMN_142881 [Dreissena polymorpha]|uniref:Uncharacterized protein n=1 Tax=Dreissena polymorpha TaxID=45954 RepID=A0A9D4JJK2_DREPO|nr:hypothetical protein DPMN_142881 [Dreissena polymorpha]
MHFAFDFSQSVSFPHKSRQMGSLYFLFLVKVMLFGFRVSGGSQIYFLYDESQTIGEDGKQSQGPNAVISMFDWALKQHCPLASSFSIHADNCPGGFSKLLLFHEKRGVKCSRLCQLSTSCNII